MKLCGKGCGSKIADDARMCDACKAERAPVVDGSKQHEAVRKDGAYDAKLDDLRKGTRWQKVRAEIVKRDPFCKRCEVALTEIVDHVVPAGIAVQQARDSRRWPFDVFVGYYLKTNLQGLCRDCHGKKTAEDKRHVGEWPSVVDAYDKAPKKRYSF